MAKGSITSMSCDPTVNGFQTNSDYIIGPGGEQLTEMGSDGKGGMTWAHTNVWAAGQLMATFDKDDTAGPHYMLNDWLGSRRVQANSAGIYEQSCQSLPFGDGLNCTGNAFTPTEHHFTGKERDAETGNDYFGARYYASNVGRWLSPDWSAGVEPTPYANLDNPQSLNLYAYVGNNAPSGADANGHVYTICDQNKHCETGISDPDFDQRIAAGRAARERWVGGKITLADGSAGGTYQQTDVDLPGDAASNRRGANLIATDGKGAINMMLSNIATSLAGGIVLKGVGWAAEALVDSGVINTGTNVVYRSLNAAGDVQYVGITNSFERRAAEHAGRFAIQRIPGLSNLSRMDAQAVEQALIEYHGLGKNGGTLLNRINSIASTNPAYAKAIQRGVEILEKVGYFK